MHDVRVNSDRIEKLKSALENLKDHIIKPVIVDKNLVTSNALYKESRLIERYKNQETNNNKMI